MSLALTACAGGQPTTTTAAGDETISVFGAYATQIEEPWDGVIHRALEAEQTAGRIAYEFTDDIGYSGDMERVLTEVAQENQPDIIFGDAFGNEEAVRRVAAQFPDIAFVFGSGGGPADPNFSVFDNWIHEPAYLAGMLAGGLSQSGVIGVVGGYPVPEVNRITNAFVAGAQEVNPEVEVKVTFLNSWFDPAAAKEAALAQIAEGADVLYAERFGVIEAAAENGLAGLRQHGRPEGTGTRERGLECGLGHGPDRQIRHRPGHGRLLHRSGPEGLLDDGQGRGLPRRRSTLTWPAGFPRS